MQNILDSEKPKYEHTIEELEAAVADMTIQGTEQIFNACKALCVIAAHKKGYIRAYSCPVRENGWCPGGFLEDYLNYCAMQMVARRTLDITEEYPTKRFNGKIASWLAYANSMVKWWLIEYNKSVIDYSFIQIPEFREEGEEEGECEVQGLEWADSSTRVSKIIELRAGINAKNILRALESLPEEFEPYHYEIMYYLATKKVLDSKARPFIVLGGKQLIRSLIYD